MLSRPAGDVLYELESALRLVDNALREFGDGDAGQPPHGAMSSAGATPALLPVIEPGPQGVLVVLDTLRKSRAVLERTADEESAIVPDPRWDLPAPGDAMTAGTSSAGGDHLHCASAVLVDVEHRLSAIVAGLGPRA